MKLNELRDKLAGEFASGNFEGGEPSIGTTYAVELSLRDLFEADRENFRHGFDAGAAAVMKEAEKLVEFIKENSECDYRGTYKLGGIDTAIFPAHDKDDCDKCAALADWQRFIGKR